MKSFSLTPLTTSTSKLNYNVLIEQEKEGLYIATALGWSNCHASGATKAEALTNLNQILTTRLEKAEIVSLEIDNPKAEHPWSKFAGMYKDNPLFNEVLADIEAYRREIDSETENDFNQLEAKE